MNTRIVSSLAVAVLPLVGVSIVHAASCSLPQDTTWCLTRIHEQSKGSRRLTYGRTYECRNGAYRPAKTTITLPLRAEPTCHETNLLDGTILQAVGTTIMRQDSLAIFFGHATISRRAATGQNIVLFQGCLELYDRVGTHHFVTNFPKILCERCDEPGHVEGWLMANGVEAHVRGQVLNALFAGRVGIVVSATI